MANQYDFSVDKGATSNIVFTYLDSNGNPINITNYCARLTLVPADGSSKRTYLSGTYSTAYGCIIDGASGTVTLILSGTETSSFTFDSAQYDLDLKAPNEAYVGGGPNIIRIFQGFVTVVSASTSTPDSFNCPEPGNPCISC